MHYTAIIFLAAELAISNGLVIETTVKDASKNEAVTALPAAPLIKNASLTLRNKTVFPSIQSPPTDAANNSTAKPIEQSKKKKEVTPENSAIAYDSSKVKKVITERDSTVRVPTAIGKTPQISPFLPFLPLGEHQENPLINFFQEVVGKRSNKTERDDSAQKKNAGKPFLFFDFVFDIREVQPAVAPNLSGSSELSKQKRELTSFNFKKPTLEELPTEKWMKRSVREDESFFDDSRLYHPLDFEEFLPKPDFFFFPETYMHRGQSKRSLRRKRDEKQTLRFGVDETRKILLRKKRAGSRHEEILRSLAEKLKKGAEGGMVEIKKYTNKVSDKIGELRPKLLADKGKRESEKKIKKPEKLESPMPELKQKEEKLVKDEKKQEGI